MGLLMLNGGAKAVTIDRCSQLGLTVSHTAAIRMQTKAGQASAQCYSWKQDTLLKEQQIRFLEVVLKNAGDGAQLDMSRDTVSSLKCFEEESYDELLAFVQGVRQGQSEGSMTTSAVTRQDIEEAVKELKNTIVHYKYVFRTYRR